MACDRMKDDGYMSWDAELARREHAQDKAGAVFGWVALLGLVLYIAYVVAKHGAGIY
jgi:hypothetical protein